MAVINEAPWQCVSLDPARLPASSDQQCQTSAMVNSLLYGPKYRNPPDLNPGSWSTKQATCSSLAASTR